MTNYVYRLKVGSKGELFLPKEYRDKYHIKPGTIFTLTIEGDKWVLTKRYSLKELLQLPPLTKPFSAEELENISKEEYEQQVQESLNDLND